MHYAILDYMRKDGLDHIAKEQDIIHDKGQWLREELLHRIKEHFREQQLPCTCVVFEPKSTRRRWLDKCLAFVSGTPNPSIVLTLMFSAEAALVFWDTIEIGPAPHIPIDPRTTQSHTVALMSIWLGAMLNRWRTYTVWSFVSWLLPLLFTCRFRVSLRSGMQSEGIKAHRSIDLLTFSASKFIMALSMHGPTILNANLHDRNGLSCGPESDWSSCLRSSVWTEHVNICAVGLLVSPAACVVMTLCT